MVKTIHNMKTNIIAQNGNINFGATVQSSHTANTKIAGVCFSFGDCSHVIDLNKQTTAIGVSRGKNGKGE
ncbi:spore germination protein [Siminovitchia sp. FSL H7-0308]|jgi:hypothetical protein|nr:spore germination protein [Siminovitchia thermophila]ONK22730.1 hypothetical protein BLX87_15000 [Bacillus sp. VT-16-64]